MRGEQACLNKIGEYYDSGFKSGYCRQYKGQFFEGDTLWWQ